MSKIAENLKYAESHEWIDPDADPAPVGISDHAQEVRTETGHQAGVSPLFFALKVNNSKSL